MERPVRVLVCALAVVVAAAPAFAAYTIRLNNGTSFTTRYEPEDASWDDSKVVFLDEVGTLISISKSEIAGIESDFETKGYGRMIDTTTMELGWAPNDAAEGVEGGAPADPLAQMQQAIDAQRQNITFDQFIEPDQLQGMPGNWIGGSFTSAPEPVLVPVPVPAPAAGGGGEAPPPGVGQ